MNNNNKKLKEEMRIKKGAFYTPEHIVNKACEMIKDIIDDKTTIIDFGVGQGAFLKGLKDFKGRVIATEIDEDVVKDLEVDDNVEIVIENSLIDISREKYNLAGDDKVVVIGNPPYNDQTSQYKKGLKGSLEMDQEVFSRDLGVSFMKMYDLISADYICIVHPLSFLIKEANFNSLKKFKKNYKLIKGYIFPSSKFEDIKKNSTEFPIVLALYERNGKGMDFNYIKDFAFNFLDSVLLFRLSEVETIDGIIPKYPNKQLEANTIGFYTLRDFNALKRNKTFIKSDSKSVINVKIEDIYKYAWLDFVKHNFKPEKEYLYGNISPIYNKKIENKEIKTQLILYLIKTNKIFNEFLKNNENQVKRIYEITNVVYNEKKLLELIK